MYNRLISLITIIAFRFKNNKISLSSFILNNKLISKNIIGLKNIITNCNVNNSIIHDFNKIQHCQFNGNNRIGDNNRLYDVNLGISSYIGSNCMISETSIGKYCSLGNNIVSVPGTHPIDFVSTHPTFYSQNANIPNKLSSKNLISEKKNIVIKNDVWIGNSVTILNGVTIGNGSIIAAGAVVNHDVEPYSIVGGVPAKLIKLRFEKQTIDLLEKSEWWLWNENKLKSNIELFNTNIESEIKNFLLNQK